MMRKEKTTTQQIHNFWLRQELKESQSPSVRSKFVQSSQSSSFQVRHHSESNQSIEIRVIQSEPKIQHLVCQKNHLLAHSSVLTPIGLLLALGPRVVGLGHVSCISLIHIGDTAPGCAQSILCNILRVNVWRWRGRSTDQQGRTRCHGASGSGSRQ